MAEPAPVLQMQGISKRFPGVQALDNVSYDLRPGEVHALVGENGAGKSTLMKILSGVYQPDEGQVLLNGQAVGIRNPRHAQELGISIVHQELSLFPNLTVAENIMGGHMPVRGWLRLEDRKKAQDIASSYLAKFDLPLDPRALLSSLSMGQQQVVEIAKALAQQARILILDEPTSSLTEHETVLLLRLIRQLRAENLSVIYISHRMEEICQISDRVTVLRDGRWVGTLSGDEIDLDTIIRMMVGRNLDTQHFGGQSTGVQDELLLSVEDLSSTGRFAGISFDLHKGEILGMAGLIGAGRTDVALAIFGAIPIHSGVVRIGGAERHIRSPHDALDLGIAYLSENRQSDSLFPGLGVRENISVTHLEAFARAGVVNQRLEAAEASRYVDQLSIMAHDVEQRIANLSGGNQQKVILARWLAVNPRILLVDEPTKGIDIGSKQEIYMLLHRLASEGVGILLISSEMAEVLALSDRILVMHEGRLAGILSRAEATEENVMILAAGQELAAGPFLAAAPY